MPRPIAENYDLARQLYLNGLPIYEIAKRINVPSNTLYQRKRREKWDCQPRVSPESKAAVIQDVAKRVTNEAIEVAEQILCKVRGLPLKTLKDCREAASALAAAYATARKALGLDESSAGGSRVNVTIYSDMPVNIGVASVSQASVQPSECCEQPCIPVTCEPMCNDSATKEGENVAIDVPPTGE